MNHSKLITLTIAIAVVSSLAISGCNSGSYSQGDANLDNNIDSVSYGFGFNIGNQLAKNGMDSINTDVFMQGLQTAFNDDSSAIPQREMMATLRSYQMKAQQKMQKKKMQEAAGNNKKGKDFLKKNKKKEGVKTTDSGLQYKVVEEGNGVSPTPKDTVVVDYTGKLLDGTEFDSNDSASIPLNRVIKGWTEGIQLMHKGATYKFWIPGNLAYGQQPPPGSPIGPNQTLMFKVKLLDVK